MIGEVRVLIDDEGLIISNPGGFIDGVNLKNLLTVEPHGRNPALADAMKRIGLAEKAGRGIDRIYEGSIIFGRPWPDYSESTSRSVKLFIQRSKADLPFAKLVADEQNRQGKPLSIYKYDFPESHGNEARFNIVKCPYFEICTRYGCPEITRAFCDGDDAGYGNLHPKLIWGRTKTIGRGGDCCNFLLEYKE